jgi:predicted phage gp36 major capsid-like protein
MGHTIWTELNNSNIWTSSLMVQGTDRVNLTLVVGSVGTAQSVIAGGSFTGSVQLHRSFDNGANWSVIDSGFTTTEDKRQPEPEPETCLYRAGVPIGAWTSGEIACRLGAGGR